MKDLNFTEKQLKEGFEFEAETLNKEDLRIATVSVRNRMFVLWFNGKCIAVLHSFAGLKNRVKKLAIKWELEDFKLVD